MSRILGFICKIVANMIPHDLTTVRGASVLCSLMRQSFNVLTTLGYAAWQFISHSKFFFFDILITYQDASLPTLTVPRIISESLLYFLQESITPSRFRSLSIYPSFNGHVADVRKGIRIHMIESLDNGGCAHFPPHLLHGRECHELTRGHFVIFALTTYLLNSHELSEHFKPLSMQIR